MVARQVLVGVGAGATTALFALFLSVSQSTWATQAPAWFGPALPAWADGSQLSLPAAAPTGSGLVSTVDSHPSPKTLDTTDMVAGLGAAPSGRDAWAGQTPAPRAEERLPASADLQPDVLDPDLYVAALSKQTIIREQPRPDARIIGFARTGALLRRAPVPASREGCAEGWFRVEPDGYVCVGQAATLDAEHPIVRLASLQPDRSLPLPYPYGTSRYPTPPLYTKIPNKDEQTLAEGDLVGHSQKGFGQVWQDAAGAPPPSLLAQGERVPRPFGYPVLERAFMTGRALSDSAFAFIDLFEADGRRWGLTADLSILPLDRLQPVRSSEFYGVVLRGAEDLPLAFMRAKGQYLYTGTASSGVRPVRAIGFREAFHLTGQTLRIGGLVFHETVEGQLLKDHPRLVLITPRKDLPKWAKDDRSWIEVSILRQTLVAYRGTQPVFATLVSTGRDGLGDPTTTHSTPQGTFLIHTKHVTSTMSGDAADDEYDLRDVPYVQFFSEGYAFHAAFWHDTFGQPRSHGCVNLSPPDARHLFSVTEPAVPLRWHSALSTKGTLVYIHP